MCLFCHLVRNCQHTLIKNLCTTNASYFNNPIYIYIMHFYTYIQLYFIHVNIWAVVFWHNWQSGQSTGLQKKRSYNTKKSADQFYDRLSYEKRSRRTKTRRSEDKIGREKLKNKDRKIRRRSQKAKKKGESWRSAQPYNIPPPPSLCLYCIGRSEYQKTKKTGEGERKQVDYTVHSWWLVYI